MPELAEAFIGMLHREHMKPRGYRKTHHTFWREVAAFTERVRFDGSRWNDRDSPWRFYIDFGVHFDGLPARVPDRDFPKTHCWTRLNRLVPGAPAEYVISGDTRRVAREIGGYLEEASQRVIEQIADLRRRYEESGTPWIGAH